MLERERESCKIRAGDSQAEHPRLMSCTNLILWLGSSHFPASSLLENTLKPHVVRVNKVGPASVGVLLL